MSSDLSCTTGIVQFFKKKASSQAIEEERDKILKYLGGNNSESKYMRKVALEAGKFDFFKNNPRLVSQKGRKMTPSTIRATV